MNNAFENHVQFQGDRTTLHPSVFREICSVNSGKMLQNANHIVKKTELQINTHCIPPVSYKMFLLYNNQQ